MQKPRFLKHIKPFNIVNGLLILLLCFITVYPLWYVIVGSFSDGAALLQGRVSFWPVDFTLTNYKVLFEYKMIPRAYLNTFIYVTAGTAVSMVLSVFCAFPLSRKEFRGRGGWSFFVAFTMLFNGGIIPTYIVVQGIGLVDTPFALFLPVALSPFNIIVLRTFFKEVPEGIIEAAKIDRCGYFRILVSIVVPYSLIGMVTILLFYLVTHWNNFMPGLMYVLRNRELLPMQNILRNIVIQEQSISESMGNTNVARGVRYATIVITVLPILAVYPFMQRYFSKGLMVGGLKE